MNMKNLRTAGRFTKFYIISMRPYYFFVTGIAGWVGVAYYESQNIAPLSLVKKALILTLLFLSWGVNQILNDFLGRKEDRINAPHRPMVSGDLPAKRSVLLSILIMIGASTITYFYLSPIAVFFIWAGALFNFFYNFSKAWGLWANIVFGLMIAISPLFGFYACHRYLPSFTSTELPYLVLMVAILNGMLTYYTYFKDYTGDKAAGQKTLVVNLGLQVSRYLSLIFSIVPAFSFIIINRFAGFSLNPLFIILAAGTTLLHFITGIQFFRFPEGQKTRSNLVYNFQAGVGGQAALISLFNPNLGLILFMLSIVMIALLFLCHRDSK